MHRASYSCLAWALLAGTTRRQGQIPQPHSKGPIPPSPPRQGGTIPAAAPYLPHDKQGSCLPTTPPSHHKGFNSKHNREVLPTLTWPLFPSPLQWLPHCVLTSAPHYLAATPLSPGAPPALWIPIIPHPRHPLSPTLPQLSAPEPLVSLTVGRSSHLPQLQTAL